MAVGDTLATWSGRPDFTGETVTAGATLLQRFEAVNGSGTTRTMPDVADPSKTWTIRNYAGTAGVSAGRWGNNLGLNRTAPATEQTSLTVPHFPGLWPSSGVMLFRAWAAFSFVMSFTPIISTRNTPGQQPLVYLSTTSDGRPRAMIYSAAGANLLDQSETLPWQPTPHEWVCYLWQVDLDARTSQVAAVRRDTGQSFVGPLRSFAGTPNLACSAAFELATLSPTASYWAGGYIDEVSYRQTTTPVVMADLVDGVRRGLPARGRDSAAGAGLTVTDTLVTATTAATLFTGARPATWTYPPTVEVAPVAITGVPMALLSTDQGATWSAATAPDDLPSSFTGWVRWSIPLDTGESVASVRLAENAPPPELDGGGPIVTTQGSTVSVPLTGTWTGTPSFAVAAVTPLDVTFTGTSMHIGTGWAIGDFTVRVTVADDSGQISAPAEFMVQVAGAPWTPPDAVDYAFQPPIVLDAAGGPVDVLPEVWEARIFSEVNGEHTVTWTMSATDPRAHLVANETRVSVADEIFTIKQHKTIRDGSGAPVITVYGEADYYDLGRKPKLAERAWADSQPGEELGVALAGTGWAVAAVTVSTRRTWTWQAGNPLDVLRQIQQVHGGDLTFNNRARTVSLLTTQGSDRGVFFAVGRNLTSVQRVLDTTQLVTRMHAVTEDGQTFAAVNTGLDYVENHDWTEQTIDGYLTFAAGTNPYTMLSMTRASLGKYAKPRTTYEADVADLSFLAGRELDRLRLGDQVTIWDEQLGIDIIHKLVRLELDLMEPWNSRITLSSTLRELGSSEATNSAVLTTGADIETKDLVPFNLLLNARADNGMAHWAGSGVTVVTGGVTGPRHWRFAGGGVRWLEQTVAVDTRDTYTVSFQLDTAGFGEGVLPVVEIIAEITYDDSTTETISQAVT